MNFHSHAQVVDGSFISSPFTSFGELTNPSVGYKWYQSQPSSDMANINFVNANPWNYTYQFLSPNQVGNPNLFSHEYEPPPTDTSKPYTTDLSAYEMFDTSSERKHVLVNELFNTRHTITSNPSLFNLTCHTTLSTGQPYYAIEPSIPMTTPCSTIMSTADIVFVSDKRECVEEIKSNEVGIETNNDPDVNKNEAAVNEEVESEKLNSVLPLLQGSHNDGETSLVKGVYVFVKTDGIVKENRVEFGVEITENDSDDDIVICNGSKPVDMIGGEALRESDERESQHRSMSKISLEKNYRCQNFVDNSCIALVHDDGNDDGLREEALEINSSLKEDVEDGDIKTKEKGSDKESENDKYFDEDGRLNSSMTLYGIAYSTTLVNIDTSWDSNGAADMLKAMLRLGILAESGHHISENSIMWWWYTAQDTLRQEITYNRLTWKQVQFLCHLCRWRVLFHSNSVQKLLNVSDNEMRPDLYGTIQSRCDEIHSNMIKRDSKVFAKPGNNKKFEESWDINVKEKNKGTGKEKGDGNSRYKASAYLEASNRLEKAVKYIEYDISSREEKQTCTKAMTVTCNFNIASRKLMLENKQAENCCFTNLKKFPDQANQKESLSHMVLESLIIKVKLVLVDDELVPGEYHVIMKGSKSSFEKEKEGISVKELLEENKAFLSKIPREIEAKEAYSSKTYEEIEASLLSMYTSFSSVLYRFNNADGVANAYFLNNIILVFDPGDIIIHFDRHLASILVCKASILVCKASEMALFYEEQVTDVLDKLRLGYESSILGIVDNGPIQTLESFSRLGIHPLNMPEEVEILKLAQMMFDSKLPFDLQLFSGGSLIKNAWYWSMITLVVIDHGHSFACGVILANFFVTTIGEQGNTITDTNGAPCKLQKFEGISESGEWGETLYNWAQNHNYWISSSVKRMVSAWYWHVTILVFDPGGSVSIEVFFKVLLSLRTRIF